MLGCCGRISSNTIIPLVLKLGIDVTTDKNEIKKFLKSKANIKVVFTTYQSGKVTAAGAKGFTFDFTPTRAEMHEDRVVLYF
jgi:hypothetical protein